MMRNYRGGLFTVLDRRAVARMIDADLPRAARGIRYVDWQPSTDLAYHEALIRFDLPLTAYRAWVAQLRLDMGPPPDGAAAWRAPPEIEAPDWWTPTDAMTPDTAWRRVGAFGSLTMKWEDGAVYAHLVDTGQEASSP